MLRGTLSHRGHTRAPLVPPGGTGSRFNPGVQTGADTVPFSSDPSRRAGRPAALNQYEISPEGRRRCQSAAFSSGNETRPANPELYIFALSRCGTARPHLLTREYRAKACRAVEARQTPMSVYCWTNVGLLMSMSVYCCRTDVGLRWTNSKPTSVRRVGVPGRRRQRSAMLAQRLSCLVILYSGALPCDDTSLQDITSSVSHPPGSLHRHFETAALTADVLRVSYGNVVTWRVRLDTLF